MSIGEDVMAAAADVKAASAAQAAPETVPEPAGTAGTGSGNQPAGTAARARDDGGRFAKGGDKKVEIATPVPPNEGAKEAKEGAPPAQKRKPPASWRPTAHEHWDTLHPAAQEEILRVESTTQQLIQRQALARKQAEAWERTIAPYKPYIQGEPTQWADNILRTGVQLQVAHPRQRAEILANLAVQMGVDVNDLDTSLQAALSGRGQPARQHQPQAEPEWRVALAQMQQQIQAMQYMPVVSAFEQKAQFLEEPMPGNRTRADGAPFRVRDAVALRLKVAEQEGVALTLDEAYDEVIARHPTVQEALKQRGEAQAAAERNARTAQAQAAASSVRSEPVVVTPEESSGGSIFDDVMASARQLSRGRR